METAFIISAIFQIIVLICFFILCSNVSNIKNKLSPNSDFSFEISLLIAMGDREKAKQVLINKMLSDPFLNDIVNSESNLNAMLGKYRRYLQELDIDFDAKKFLEFRNIK